MDSSVIFLSFNNGLELFKNVDLHIFIKFASRYSIIFAPFVSQILSAITFSNWLLLVIGRSIDFLKILYLTTKLPC